MPSLQVCGQKGDKIKRRKSTVNPEVPIPKHRMERDTPFSFFPPSFPFFFALNQLLISLRAFKYPLLNFFLFRVNMTNQYNILPK